MFRWVKKALLFLMACGSNNMVSNDMATSSPTLAVPGSCAQATVTLASFYSTLISPKCAIPSCHDGTTAPNFAPDMTAFRNDTVGATAGRPLDPGLDYIKPNDVNESFVLYKITNQQAQIQSGGAAMPSGQPLLSATDQCTLINWVRSGAN